MRETKLKRVKLFTLIFSLSGLIGCSNGVEVSSQKSQMSEPDRINQRFNSKNRAFRGLKRIQEGGQFIFGQQSYNLMAKTEEGSKNILYGAEDLLASPSEELVNDAPGVLGIDVHYFAIMPNQAANQQTAKAVKAHMDRGGLVAFDWHMRGCYSEDRSSKGMYTNVENYGDQGATKDNNKCICAIANNWSTKEGETGKSWLDDRIDLFANQLKNLGDHYSTKAFVFRPFHEHTGNWFWWHEPFWNCGSFEEGKDQGENLVSGAAAYKKVFRYTVNRLKGGKHGLENLLIAYSPDKLYAEGFDYSKYPPASKDNKNTSREKLKDKYWEALPIEVVDILGFDVYDPVEMHGPIAAQSLSVISEIARNQGKIAALTETGSYQIDQGKNDWFMNDLLNETIQDSEIAFAMTWENRSKSYVPLLEGQDQKDFIDFYQDERSIFLSELSGLFH